VKYNEDEGRHMPKQNITLSLDKNLIRQARQLSARKSTSVSKLLSEELERLVRDHAQYEQAKRRALATMKKGFHMGGRVTATRDEFHDRQGLR
jgi:post-segregation antitoxin (ccd killing protein)